MINPKFGKELHTRAIKSTTCALRMILLYGMLVVALSFGKPINTVEQNAKVSNVQVDIKGVK